MNELFDFFKPKKKKEIKGLVLGLDNAGKTTILKAFKGETVKIYHQQKVLIFKNLNIIKRISHFGI